jgi:hypothetical protein
MPGATSHRVYSDLFNISNFVVQTCVSQGKNLIIDALREYFKKDTFYRYEENAWGFPMTPNLTDLPPDIQERRTSRIYIGDIFRFEKRFYPSVTVRHSSAKYYPISFNQNFFNTKYRLDLVIDGYGERSYVRTPTHHTICGAWDQTFEIIIATDAIPDREELSDIISAFMIGVARQELSESGLGIKTVSISGEREEDYANDKIYLQTISIETYSEWRREIPIDSIVEMINFCFSFGLFSSGRFVTDTTSINISDSITVEPYPPFPNP